MLGDQWYERPKTNMERKSGLLSKFHEHRIDLLRKRKKKQTPNASRGEVSENFGRTVRWDSVHTSRNYNVTGTHGIIITAGPERGPFEEIG